MTQVPLFAGLSSRDVESLGQSLQSRHYARGDVVFLQGDPGTALYIVESGEVKIVLTSAEGKEVILAILGPGQFFGELSLLDGETRSADVVAKEDCSVLLLQREDFQLFINEHPSAAQQLLAVLSRRLREADQLLHDAAFLDVPARLARLLIKLGEAHGRGEPDGLVLGMRLTQEDMAAMVGSSRETVNKVLRAWERDKLIVVRGRITTIVQPRELRKLSRLVEEVPPRAEDLAD